jgi:hypothetical protein
MGKVTRKAVVTPLIESTSPFAQKKSSKHTSSTALPRHTSLPSQEEEEEIIEEVEDDFGYPAGVVDL